MSLTVGSLFSGIGGLDLGLERAGFECCWQCEIDKSATRCLERHWPNMKRYRDATNLPLAEMERVNLICGGDPCPIRSNARHIHHKARTIKPAVDFWPYFRQAVWALRPLWVLRENVVSPDAGDVAADLGKLGYLCVVLECNGAQVTGQSRPREYLCGVLESTGICPVELFSRGKGNRRDSAESDSAGPIAACLTTHRRRYDHRDNYILENGGACESWTIKNESGSRVLNRDGLMAYLQGKGSPETPSLSPSPSGSAAASSNPSETDPCSTT